MSAMEDSQKSESIKSLIGDIDKNYVVLPEFQRNFVWDLSKTYELFDSLVRDIFIGSIIYGVPSFGITTRELDQRPRKGNGSRRKLELTSFNKSEIDTKVQKDTFRLVLDGQQRITSIYRALKGVDEVWFIVSDDIDQNCKNIEKALLEFTGVESEAHLSINMNDIYKMLEGELPWEEDKKKVLERSSYITSNNFDEDKFNLIFRKYLIVSNLIQDLLKSEKLMSYYLLNTSEEKFALFFERSNSKGIQLSFIDILAAKLYVGFNLREKAEEYEDDNDYKLNRELIVRVISYIVSDGRDIGRGFILKSLSHEHFIKHWDTVCDLYTKVLNFLTNSRFIVDQKWLPYDIMLIPLILFLREVPSQEFSQVSEDKMKFIKYWYWASIFSQRYSSSVNNAIVEDSKDLIKVAKDKKIARKAFINRFPLNINTVDDLFGLSKKGNSLYKGALNVIHYANGGLLDWKNTSLIQSNTKNIDDHHIFPQAYLKQLLSKNSDEYSYINAVPNRTLIPKITNIKIGKKAPSIYLKELQNDNTKLSKSLVSHLIPTEIIQTKLDDNFSEFAYARAEKIFDLINENTKKPTQAEMAKIFLSMRRKQKVKRNK